MGPKRIVINQAQTHCPGCSIPMFRVVWDTTRLSIRPPTSEQQLTLKDAQFLFWSKYFSSRELRHIKSRNPLFLVQGLGRGRPRSSKVKSDHRVTQNEVYYNPCSIHVMRGSRRHLAMAKPQKTKGVILRSDTLFIFFLESYLYSRSKPSIDLQSG